VALTRIGVVGYGSRIHGMICGPFRQIDPDLRVVAVVDPDESGARDRLAECDRDDVVFYESVESMMRAADLDAVAVGTRCNLHAAIAGELAAFDVPLCLEKPVAVTMEQAVELECAFERARCPVVVSFPLRVSPLCDLARQYIEAGAVGEPLHVNAVNYVPYGTVYWEQAYRDYDVTGGLFLQKATHDFDYLMYLMGQSVTRIAATATRGRIFGGDRPAGLRCSQCDDTATCPESPENRRRNSSGGSAADHPCLFSLDCGSGERLNEDCSSALLEFADGSHGVYSQVFYARRDAGARGATVSGYDGTVGFDWYTNELKRVRHHHPFSATERAGGDMSHFGGDIALADDFLGVVHGSRSSRTPIETGLQSVYACLAARQSAGGGGFVEVRQVGADG
jgi:predicted dehydrogenase